MKAPRLSRHLLPAKPDTAFLGEERGSRMRGLVYDWPGRFVLELEVSNLTYQEVGHVAPQPSNPGRLAPDYPLHTCSEIPCTLVEE